MRVKRTPVFVVTDSPGAAPAAAKYPVTLTGEAARDEWASATASWDEVAATPTGSRVVRRRTAFGGDR